MELSFQQDYILLLWHLISIDFLILHLSICVNICSNFILFDNFYWAFIGISTEAFIEILIYFSHGYILHVFLYYLVLLEFYVIMLL